MNDVVISIFVGSLFIFVIIAIVNTVHEKIELDGAKHVIASIILFLFFSGAFFVVSYGVGRLFFLF